ncbi:MAG: PSD1 and planctomycete cytochrome C domain-containing protein [Gemmataceae bacterium]
MARTLALVCVASLAVSPVRADGDPAAASFEKDVLPLFKAKCFSCHDGRKATAGLRLDVRGKAFGKGESGAVAIVPGKPDASEVVKRITKPDDDELLMPTSGDRLTPAEVAKVKAWIAAGAKWPDALANEPKGVHWAFIPPKRPAVPSTKFPASHPIDAFVRARLAKEGLTPTKEADKVTLCRRVHLDLTGLPPSPKEVDAFLADDRPDAYERLVDRLLASPHFGEKWARPWLDAARYADSDGFEKDKPRFVWFYRDWVINALNRDLPYDRFVIEQIAGDLLPNATQDQLVATGFLRNSMINEEGGVHPEQFRMEAMFDRMDAIGKGVLGLTVQCGQCHSHKFDPISQTEYYRLFAFLNNAHEASPTVYTPAEQMKRAEVLRAVKDIEADLKHKHPDWQARMAAWEKSVAGDQPKWTVVRPDVDDLSTGGQKYLPQPDGSLLAQGYAPTKHAVKLAWTTTEKDITGFRLELLNDPNLPRNGPGRSLEGTGALTEFEAWYAPADKADGKFERVKFKRATADVEQPETPLKAFYDDRGKAKRVTGPVAFAIDGKTETAWGHDLDPGRRNLPRKAVFTADKPIPGFPKGTAIHVYLKQNHGGWNSDDNQNCNLGRFRLSTTTAPDPVADPLPMAVREILKVPAEKRTPAQVEAVFAHWRTTVPEWKEANEAIDAAWREHPEGTTQLALQERADPRPTAVLKRGDFLKPGEKVDPGVPAALHPLSKTAPPNRLGFAQWLVDPNSPTTARAAVNRVWQGYFGAGIVTSPEDLGTQSDPPTHPDLLDWLACEFMRPSDGSAAWGVKRLHRLIVTSATYKQGSAVTPDLLARDPANKLLARGPRFRVDAESVRDIALAASGLLERTVGGPSVYPPVPGFLMLPPASYGPKVWPEATGPDRYRRSLYVFSFRSIPYPPLTAFDAPNGDFACVKRTRSNTPLQALVGMNEPIFLEAAQALARRVLSEGGKSDTERMSYAFRLVTARTPAQAEADALLRLLAKQTAKFADPASDPWAVAFRGPEEHRKLPHTATPAQAAAWTAVARVLLNLDETVTKE